MKAERLWLISNLRASIGDIKNVTVAQLEIEFVAEFSTRPPGFLNRDHLNTQRKNIREQDAALIKVNNLANETEADKQLREDNVRTAADLLVCQQITARENRMTRIANAEKLATENVNKMDELAEKIRGLIADVDDRH